MKKVLLDAVSTVVLKFSAVWVSLVRTYVPMALGALVGWAASKGVDVSPALEADLEFWFITGGMALWYLVARLFEASSYGWLQKIGGYMNGVPRKPVYEQE